MINLIEELVRQVNALPLPELGEEKEYQCPPLVFSDGRTMKLELFGSPTDWQTRKRWTHKPFDGIVLGTELVDCHYSDWWYNLGISEPYRHLAVWKADFNTSDELVQFARDHRHWYTNKMLAVIDIDRPARKLLCMSCYDACWTYIAKVEVQNVIQAANASAPEADSARREDQRQSAEG